MFLLIVLITGAAFGIYAYLNRDIESTDDAFIDAHITQIAAQVDGLVVGLDVSDNQRVHRGDLLVRLDRRDGEVKLAQARAQKATAEAQLAQNRAQLDVQSASIAQLTAQLDAAQSDAQQAREDLQRYAAVDPHAVTRQQVDTARNQARASGARMVSSQRALEAGQAQIAVLKAQVQGGEAAVAAADAQIAQAQLTLAYTEIRAPFDGYVTKRSVETGNVIKLGSSLLSLVSPEVWVTANFKETQLARIRPGQKVVIGIDALPGRRMRGHVDSVQDGTGSVFSTLPAENATGNYVKLVQRVPVKVVFEPDEAGDLRLLPGLSVVPEVDMGTKSDAP